MGNRTIVGAACSVFILALCAAPSGAVVINFDVDANGNPLTAPPSFASTQALRNEFSALGVTFSGPGPLDGGAILDEAGNFGVPARSAPNFLAFNRKAALLTGGVARDPETLTFSTPLSSVSIFASGGDLPTTFRMEAFSGGGTPVGSATQNSPVGGYAQLSINNPTQPIERVVLTEVGGDASFVYDDLTFEFIPEPTGIATMLVVAAGLFRRRHR